MITSQQIARLAGVSRATVSRVFNGSARVSAETKKRVYAASAALGYRPHILSQIASSERSHMIALILFGRKNALNLTHLTKTHCYFYLELLRFIESEVAREHYDLLLASRPDHTLHSEDDIATNFLPALQTRRVEGVIALTPCPDDPHIQALCHSTIPTVFIDTIFQGPYTTYVKSDYLDGVHQATEHLLVLGHRRIACFIGNTLTISGAECLLGYQQTMARAGLIMDPHLVLQPGWEARDAYRAAMKLLSERRDFTAIVAGNDMMALGILRALHEHHICVPEEMSLVGIDDIDQSENADPPLSTLRRDKQAISQRAVQRLMHLIHEEEPPTPLNLPTRLIVRASIGPAPNGD